jgi:hypothetical protein
MIDSRESLPLFILRDKFLEENGRRLILGSTRSARLLRMVNSRPSTLDRCSGGVPTAERRSETAATNGGLRTDS